MSERPIPARGTIHIAHLTSAHSRYDTRIFLKECRSLAAAGYRTSLVVADGGTDELKDGVNIYAVPKGEGRLDRMRNATRRVFQTALAIDAGVYHLHDPELLPIGSRLKRRGKTVVFDAHEDLPKQLLSKPYLHPWLSRVLSVVFAGYQDHAVKRFDGIITATPAIRDRFERIHPNTTDINNYPLLGELATERIDWSVKEPWVCYVGGMSFIRGIRETVEAMEHVSDPIRLRLAGSFLERSVESDCHKAGGWRRVDALGFLDREGVRDLLSRSVAGLVTFHPAPNHLEAQPNKIFEYMSAGVPVIGSRFPLWQEIIEGNHCGLCVDPFNPEEIAEAIEYLVANREEAEEMGRNGQRAVEERYNWSIEEDRLIRFYQSLAEA